MFAACSAVMFSLVILRMNGVVKALSKSLDEQEELHRRLEHQAMHDPLTGLANRTLFAERVSHALSRPGRRNQHLAVMLLDLDAFKSVNVCGVSPVEASSGRVVRQRLNRGVNRDANRALHPICVVRLRVDERTRAYLARRASEGKSKREIMRYLKRYVAREVYRILMVSVAFADSA